MPEKRGLFTRLASMARWLLFAALVCVAGLFMCRQFVLAQLDGQIRDRVQSMFAAHYTDLDVRIEVARRVEGKGIEIRGLSIRSNLEASAYRELVYIDEMFSTCKADLAALIAGKPEIGQVTVRRMKVRATCYENGKWNVSKLLPLPDFGGSVPAISIEDSTVELLDVCRKGTGGWALRDVDVQLRAQRQLDRSRQWKFAGTLLGDHFKRVKLQGQVNPRSADWSAWGTIDGLEMSHRLLGALPADVSNYLSFLATLRARAHFEFRLNHQPGDSQPVRCVLQGHLAEGRVDDPRLPLPLTDLDADVYCDNQELRMEKVTARSGSTSLQLSCRCRNFLSESPQFVLSGDVQHLQLDERLYHALPQQYRDKWDEFSPAGIVDISASLTLQDGRLVPDAQVACRDISFAYRKFPYRLQNGNGVIRLDRNKIRVADFTAVAGGQTLHMAAAFDNPGPQSTGWLTVRSAGPIPLDEELIAAMTPTGQQIIHSLHPTGAITVTNGRMERSVPGEAMHTRWELDVNDCSLQYDKFPYTIQKITGNLILVDGQWQFHNLKGIHGSNYILCDGVWMPAADGAKGGELTLNFKCWDVPLDDSLRTAIGNLQPGAERFWASLRPRGTVDHVAITMRHDSRSRQTKLDLIAEKWSPDQNVEGRTVNVHPKWFPLRLEEVTGRVRFADGQFQLEDIRALRGNSTIELAGRGHVTKDQRWEVVLTKLIGDRADVDHEFLEAVPEAIRPGLRQLKYRGLLSLNGNAWFRGGDGLPLTAGWDVLLDIEDGALENELKLAHIHGGLRLTGEKRPSDFFSRGELDIDSLMWRDIQITQVQGPLWLDAQQLILGSRAGTAQRGQIPRQVTATVMGGRASMDAHLLLDDDLHFAVDATIDEGDVAEFARSMHSARHDITGKVFAVVRFKGAKAGLHTLEGSGEVRLRESDVYELPIMVQLLSFLSLRQPDTTAFTRSDIDFRINGEQIYLDRIDFSGDVISLKGKGWMDLSRRVNLDFYALVGRQDFQLPIIKALLAEASRNILLIQVAGTIDEPQVIRKPLPELDETLQRIFPEAAPRTAGPKFPWSQSQDRK